MQISEYQEKYNMSTEEIEDLMNEDEDINETLIEQTAFIIKSINKEVK